MTSVFSSTNEVTRVIIGRLDIRKYTDSAHMGCGTGPGSAGVWHSHRHHRSYVLWKCVWDHTVYPGTRFLEAARDEASEFPTCRDLLHGSAPDFSLVTLYCLSWGVPYSSGYISIGPHKAWLLPVSSTALSMGREWLNERGGEQIGREGGWREGGGLLACEQVVEG